VIGLPKVLVEQLSLEACGYASRLMRYMQKSPVFERGIFLDTLRYSFNNYRGIYWMRETIEENCPLCERLAEYYKVDHGRLKYFKCSTCSYFQVSEQAELKLSDAPKEWKDALSKRAQNPPEDHLMVLEIRRLKKSYENDVKELVTDYIPKSECCL